MPPLIDHGKQEVKTDGSELASYDRTPTSIFVTSDDDIVITTTNNRNFVFDQKGNLQNAFSYERGNPRREDDYKSMMVVQNEHFGGVYSNAHDGHVFVKANGFMSGVMHENTRDREILGISTEANPSFCSKEPFATRHIINLLRLDVSDEKKELLMKNMDVGTSSNLQLDISAYVKKIEENKDDRSIPWNMQIYQTISLSAERILITLFSDHRLKTEPSKNTPYYFLIFNLKTNQIEREFAPIDGSVFKGSMYLLLKDETRKQLIFKTAKSIYFYDFEGNEIDRLSLSSRKLAGCRDWDIVHLSKDQIYLYDKEVNWLFTCELGTSTEELSENLIKAIKKVKQLDKALKVEILEDRNSVTDFPLHFSDRRDGLDFYLESYEELTRELNDTVFQALVDGSTEYKILHYKQDAQELLNTLNIEPFKNKDKIAATLNLWGYLARAYYLVCYNVDKEVTIDLKVGSRTLQGLKIQEDVGVLDWMNALNIFIASRDRQGMDIMMAAPDEAFGRKYGDKDTDVFEWSVIKAMKLAVMPNSDSKETLLAFQEAQTNVSKARRSYDFIKIRFVPMLQLYEAIYQNDEDLFNQRLKEVLNGQKKHWSMKSKRNNSIGWLNWEILAAITIAYDRKMEIGVTSDYAPEWLWKG